jgi:uncharacterized membrane protein HdeD (DUF308 family)
MDSLKNHRTLLFVEGILFTILGFFAVALPGISTLSAEIFIGWLLIISGAIQLYRTFKMRETEGFAGSLIVGLLYMIFGILLILFPIAGIYSLTALLIFFFAAEGIAKIFLGFQFRSVKPWGWFIVNGVIALLLALVIWWGWPATALWTLGMLVGINLIFFGVSLISLALALPKNDEPPKQ